MIQLFQKYNWSREVGQYTKSKVTGIILAGGKGLRLGREKALEKIGQQRLIDRVIESLEEVCQDILVVTSQVQFKKIESANVDAKIVVDLYPGKSAIGGIYTGLLNTTTFYNLVVACDMPFLNSRLLRYMIDSAPGFDVVVPQVNDNVEPLHAVYSVHCIHTIELLLRNNRLAVSEILRLVKTKYIDSSEITEIDPEHTSFFNINTPGDLIQAEKLIEVSREMKY
jgi:molybdopterin-guanine dinucleotide biosynthesis protein A